MNKYKQSSRNVVAKFGALVLCLFLVTFNAYAEDTRRPSRPNNVTTTSLSETQINLAWGAATDNVGVSFYRIMRDNVEIATSTAITFSDSNLSPGVSYSYKIQAEDAEGNVSRFSRKVTGSTLDSNSLSPPGNVSATPTSEIRIDLAWSPPSGTDGVFQYFIFRNGVEIAESSSTSYMDRSLAAGTDYTYWIEATDDSGNRSSPSELVTASTFDTTSPTAPTNLIATANSETQVTLSWNAATDNVGIKEYHIFRDNIQIASTTTKNFIDLNVSADTNYSYKIQAEDNAGNLSAKSVAAVANTPDVTPPTPPQNVTATPQSEVKIDLHWNASTDNVKVTEYHIYRNGAFLWTVPTFSGQTYVDRDLQAATSYTYFIIAVDDAGNESLPSASVTAGTLDNSNPTKPEDRVATGISETEIHISWSPSTDNVGVSGYSIKRDDVEIATTQTTEYSDTGLSAGTTYTYGITAFDAVGNISNTGNTTGATPDLTPPSKPKELIATAVSDVEIQLSWDPSTDNVGVTSYQVFREGQRIANTTDEFYADSRLATARTYSYTIIAFDDADNESAESASVTETTFDSVPPSKPSDLNVADLSSTEITMSWDPSSDNAGDVTYSVFKNDVFLTEVTSPTFTDAGLSPETEYSYKISALDESGNESEHSSILDVITLLSAVPTQIPQGVFYLLGDNTNAPSNEEIENPAVTGFTIIAKWQSIEISEGVYDWTELEQKINAITSRGKLVRLAITHGGQNTPQWVFDLGVETFTFTDEGETITIPIFWDEIFLEKKVNFVNAIGQHFASNTNVFAISAPCVNAKTGDWNFPAKTEQDVQNWIDKGYSSELLKQTCETVFDAASAASPNKFIAAAVGAVSSNLDEDSFGVAQHLIDYANSKSPGKLIPMSGSLGAATSSPSDGGNLFVWQLIYDNAPNSAGQLVWFVTDDESCRVNGGEAPCDPATTLTKVVDTADDLELSMLEIYGADILNEDLAHVINYAANILTNHIITVSSLTDGSTVQSTVNLEVEISDFDNANRVEYFIDDHFLTSEITPPYKFNWDSTTVKNGLHTLSINVSDNDGNKSVRTIKINVQN